MRLVPLDASGVFWETVSLNALPKSSLYPKNLFKTFRLDTLSERAEWGFGVVRVIQGFRG